MARRPTGGNRPLRKQARLLCAVFSAPPQDAVTGPLRRLYGNGSEIPTRLRNRRFRPLLARLQRCWTTASVQRGETLPCTGVAVGITVYCAVIIIVIRVFDIKVFQNSMNFLKILHFFALK